MVFLQVAISFQLHRGNVVLAKSVNPDRVRDNLKAVDLNLDPEDMRRLRELDQNKRFLRFFMMKTGMTGAEFWDEEEDKKYAITEPSAKKAKAEE